MTYILVLAAALWGSLERLPWLTAGILEAMATTAAEAGGLRKE